MRRLASMLTVFVNAVFLAMILDGLAMATLKDASGLRSHFAVVFGVASGTLAYGSVAIGLSS